MGDYIKFIADAWRNFIENDYVDPNVRKEIAESWVRCKNYGVDYNSGKGRNSYKIPSEIKEKENEILISVAASIMKNLYNIVKGTGFAILLTDKEGYIIHVIGDENIMKRADELNFVKGSLWTEKAVGTNAIGTAIYLNRPIQTIGAEHYGKNQHSWTCSSAPINDEDGNLVGCINMSGNYYDAHLHTLAMVIASAKAIENQLALTNSYNLLNTTFDSVFEGLIVLDENLKIQRLNNRTTDVLNLSMKEALKLDIKSITKDLDFKEILTNGYNNIDCNFYVKSKIIKCIINVVPIKTNNEIKGFVITLREAKHVHKLVGKIVGYKATYTFDDFITKNDKMKKVINLAKKAASSDCNILIEGESGTGKEVIAQAIHNFSQRANKPFVAINCASIPRELVESELFGYERGAFTGANREGNPGKFELADGGTIFLDEIGELPLDIQTKLLRVLDNNKITRIGSTYEKQLDVRVIGATNRVLKDEIRKKSFREDLYYRLSVINIKTLPLRERKEDIEPLVSSFINLLNENNSDKCKSVSYSYIKKLQEYNWSGNVRELRNVVERDYYLCEDEISVDNDYVSSEGVEKAEDKNEIISMQKLEKENIEKAIYNCNGNIVKAASLLNISRATIYRKIKKYNILMYHYEKI